MAADPVRRVLSSEMIAKILQLRTQSVTERLLPVLRQAGEEYMAAHGSMDEALASLLGYSVRQSVEFNQGE